jgi:hypothetical protein
MTPSSPASYNQGVARRLWQMSAEMTGLPVRMTAEAPA